MPISTPNYQRMLNYFQQRLDTYGSTPRGVDWNSVESQEIRFAQLAKVIHTTHPFSLLDYGCGYGAFADYLLQREYPLQQYIGFDFLSGMVEKACEMHPHLPQAVFTSNISDIPLVDYSVVSGTFNVKLEASDNEWTNYVLGEIQKINELSRKGFAFNLLTKYSDKECMKDYLYYADPCVLFDYCKRNFSRNVALLHDYEVYDFTIIVRKSLS